MEKNFDLIVENLKFSYPTGFKLSDISFAVEEGSCFQIMGDATGGKTTLLKLCVGLLLPEEGYINLLGQEIIGQDIRVAKIREKVGFVFENPTPINNITVFENIALPLQYHTKISKKEIKEKVGEILERLNISCYADQRPVKLSIRERIKLDIARSLILEPKVLFLDDVFLNLSLSDYSNFLALLLDIKREKGTTLILASNERVGLSNLAKYVLVLREGKPYHYDISQNILRSEDFYIKGLLWREVIGKEEVKMKGEREKDME